MKKALQVTAFGFLAFGLTGCVNWRGYFVDRGRDAADIVTVTAGYGLGARVRIGPLDVAVPLEGRYHMWGLNGGEFFRSTRVHSGGTSLLPWQWDEAKEPSFCLEGWRPGPIGEARHKAVDVDVHTPLFVTSVNPPENGAYWFQVEASGGFLASLRLGANPIELADFVFGLLTADFLGDDLELKREE